MGFTYYKGKYLIAAILLFGARKRLLNPRCPYNAEAEMDAEHRAELSVGNLCGVHLLLELEVEPYRLEVVADVVYEDFLCILRDCLYYLLDLAGASLAVPWA